MERNLQIYVSVLILHCVIDASASVPLVAEDHFFDVRERRVRSFIERPALTKQLDEYLYNAAGSQV